MSELPGQKGLTVERLRAFCDIVEAGSVVAAARKTGIGQDQYSRQIRALERAVGAKLFFKEGRFLRPTREGIRLAAVTRAYFDALGEIAGKGPDKPTRIGASDAIMRWMLIPRYAEILNAVGAIKVENHRTREIIDAVLNSEVDLGIIRADAATMEFEVEAFPALTYALAVPRALLPEKSASAILNVRDLPFVSIDGDGAFVRAVTGLFTQHDLPVRIVGRVESFSLAVELAKSFPAATIVPKQAMAEFPSETFAQVALEGMAKLDRPLAVICNKQAVLLSSTLRRNAARLARLFSGSQRS